MKSASYFVLNFGLQRCLEAVRIELTELFDGVAKPLRLGLFFHFCKICTRKSTSDKLKQHDAIIITT
jgi:hypothetical protein